MSLEFRLNSEKEESHLARNEYSRLDYLAYLLPESWETDTNGEAQHWMVKIEDRYPWIQSLTRTTKKFKGLEGKNPQI
jgi:hypothetical protein